MAWKLTISPKENAVMDKGQKATGLQKDDKFIKVPDGLKLRNWRHKEKKLTAYN